jgi:hypothetical protein
LLALSFGLVILTSRMRMRSVLAFAMLVLGICLVTLWCRSFGDNRHSPADAVAYVRRVPAEDRRTDGIGLSAGCVLIQSGTIWGMTQPDAGWQIGRGACIYGRVPEGFLGFGFSRQRTVNPVDSGGEGWTLKFPVALPLLILMVYPLLIARQLLRSTRKGPQQCLVCGYDLRASPGRCPECGTVPTLPVSSAPPT